MTSNASMGSDWDHGDRLSLLRIANLYLPYWRFLVGLPLVVAVLVAAYVVLLPTEFAASSSFTSAATNSRGGNVAGLAAQLGITVQNGGGTESPAFYEDLINSNVILAQVGATEYSIGPDPGGDTDTGLIADFHEIEGVSDSVRIRRTIGHLKELITTASDPATGVVTLTTRARNPDLAVAINRRTIELVNEFNLERRQSRAKGERAFVAERLTEAENALIEAEEALARFMEGNRSYASSPDLAFEASRLQRRVDLRQQVYTSLAQAYETARIEEVRSTPVITLIERPDLTVHRRPRRAVIWAGLGFFGTAVVAVLFVTGWLYVDQERRREPDEYRSLRRQLQNLRDRLFAPFVRSRSSDG